MNDKNHNIMNEDDEYQFPKDEYLSPEDSSVDESLNEADEMIQKPGFFDRYPMLRNKKLWVIGVIVIVFIVGMNMMHHARNNKVIMQKPAPSPTQQIAEQVSGQIGSLRSSQASTQNNLSELKSQVATLQSQLSSTNASNTQLTQSVTTLEAQVKLLTKTVAQNTKALTVKKTASKQAATKPITYTVKAVVPGRAWLVSSTGESRTVSVGDVIDSRYGRVTLIDADMGRVLTSQNRIIHYGQNDH